MILALGCLFHIKSFSPFLGLGALAGVSYIDEYEYVYEVLLNKNRQKQNQTERINGNDIFLY